jgi:hypothetical protein
MPPIRIGSPRLETSPDGGNTVSAAVEVDGAPLTLWYTYRGVVPRPRAETFLAALLLPAMARRLPIECESPVSPALLRQLPTIQDIYATWTPTLARVPVHAPAGPVEEPGDEVAAFFTGGVDSFHTALAHQDEIRTLVYVKSFDPPVRAQAVTLEIRSRLEAAAARLGARLVEVTTNARAPRVISVTEPARLSPTLWNFELAHGAALAAVAHGLPAAVGRVYVAASTTYDDLFPWGSHPLLDPLWSSESLRIVHDGCAFTRIEKVRRLAGSDVALDALRVCAVPERTLYNCCRCEKCIRTMVGLDIAGGLDRCRAFAEPLNLLRVALLPNDHRTQPYLVENLRAAEATGSHERLARALRIALRPGGLERRMLRLGLSARRLWRNLGRTGPAPGRS